MLNTMQTINSHSLPCLITVIIVYNTLFTRSKYYLDCNLDRILDCNLDHNPKVVAVYTEQSLFYTTNRITLLFPVQSLFHSNPSSIWTKIILDRNPD